MVQHTPASNPETAKRLPCRGCLPDCVNYDTCDGKPWRADKASKAPANQPHPKN
jgi:hypothetical protein